MSNCVTDNVTAFVYVFVCVLNLVICQYIVSGHVTVTGLGHKHMDSHS